MSKTSNFSNFGLLLRKEHVHAKQPLKVSLSKIKSKFLMGMFLLATSTFLVAQKNVPTFQVAGQVVEKSSGKELPYVTVILKNDSTKEKKAQACDGAGNFVINLKAEGKYQLVLSAVGYKEVHIPVNVSGAETKLGQLQMEPGAELNAVTVTAQK